MRKDPQTKSEWVAALLDQGYSEDGAEEEAAIATGELDPKDVILLTPDKMRYFAEFDDDGEPRALYRVGELSDGWFANPSSGGCVFESPTNRGIAWKVSGLGGADFAGEEVPKATALAILKRWSFSSDSLDV